jgi:hypothetical protein
VALGEDVDLELADLFRPELEAWYRDEFGSWEA